MNPSTRDMRPQAKFMEQFMKLGPCLSKKLRFDSFPEMNVERRNRVANRTSHELKVNFINQKLNFERTTGKV